MAAFSFIALSPGGSEQKGFIEADSSRQVRQMLRDQGLTPLRIDAAHKSSPQRGGLMRGPGLAIADLALFTRQLATLLQSSMPLEEALGAIARQAENHSARRIYLAVRSRVLEGHGLADSLAEFPRAFPPLYRATVAAGEHSGHLDLVLNRLADYSESAYSSRQKLKLALLYPSILFVLAIAIVSGLMAFVVPDIVEVFIAQGQSLPPLTRGLIGLSHFIVDYGLLLLFLLLLLFFCLRYLLLNEGLRLRWHKQILALPLLGKLARASNTARYASTLSILSSSGVALVDAMQIAGEVMGNLWLKQTVKQAAQQVREGGSLHQAIDRSGYFPPIMVHMIASGEASGSLDQMLERVAQSQQRELDAKVATLIGVFEPMMLLFMGMAVLIIVIAILQPIFDINALI